MSFREMAAQREQEASQLGEDEIWFSIVSKFVLLDFPIPNIAEMVMQACGDDVQIIEKALKQCVVDSIISEEQSIEMLVAVKSLAAK